VHQAIFAVVGFRQHATVGHPTRYTRVIGGMYVRHERSRRIACSKAYALFFFSCNTTNISAKAEHEDIRFTTSGRTQYSPHLLKSQTLHPNPDGRKFGANVELASGAFKCSASNSSRPSVHWPSSAQHPLAIRVLMTVASSRSSGR
jgi:hypothetical protein